MPAPLDKGALPVKRPRSTRWAKRDPPEFCSSTTEAITKTSLESGYGVVVEEPRELPPDRIEGDGVLLRRWCLEDAEDLGRAVAESQEHLHPWMPWIAGEPKTLEQRRARIAEWERDWAEGRDFVLAIFVGDKVAGGCGLHRRGDSSTLEIGYWLHPSFTGQGLATTATRLLTDAAFALSGIEHVEIHSDKANTASAGVPERLGFTYLGETPDEAAAPGELGIDRAWRISRAAWHARSGNSH